MLTGCVIPGAGLGATFNDTANDARKIVTWTTRGTEADATFSYYNPTTGYEGCLGLGTPWYSGSLANPAVWVPADGLYEAAPPLCVNNGAFFISPGVFSQPCTDVTYQQVARSRTTSTRSPTTCLPATADSEAVADPAGRLRACRVMP